MSKLFSPVNIGPYQLSHRVAMAPLTRMRSDPGDIPSDLMVEYYFQRASKGGLIISEATPVSIRGYGYAGAPGVYSDRQIEGWRRVTDAVHAKRVLVDEVGLPLTLNTDASRFGFSFLRLHNPPGRTGGPLIGALHDAFARFPNATFADRTPGVR